MKCRMCGAEAEPGATVCKYCGEKFAAQPITEPAEKPEDAGDTMRFNVRRARPEPFTESGSDERGEESVVYTNRPETQSGTQYCTKCGRPLDGRTGKCIICDYREVGSKSYEDEEEGSADMAGRRKKKKKNTAGIIALAVLGLALIFGITFFIFFRMLGGSFGADDATESPSPGITATAEPTDAPTEAPTDAPTDTPKKRTTETQSPTKAPTVTSNPKDEAEEGDPAAFKGGKYIFDTHEKVIDDDTLASIADTRENARLLYYEMYARYGMTFDDDDLIEYFEAQKWYTPDNDSGESGIKAKFNSTETINEKTIREYMTEKGWY